MNEYRFRMSDVFFYVSVKATSEKKARKKLAKLLEKIDDEAASVDVSGAAAVAEISEDDLVDPVLLLSSSHAWLAENALIMRTEKLEEEDVPAG